MKSIFFLLILSFSWISGYTGAIHDHIRFSEPDPGYRIELKQDRINRRVDVFIDGKPFTSFAYADTLMKPILYPVYTAGENFLTRGWPVLPRSGEHTDHPHQRGIWLNYGDINGLDFWGNSYAIPEDIRKTRKGRIRHLGISEIKSGNDRGSLTTHESWTDSAGHELLSEKTSYYFFPAEKDVWIIDRITTLTAREENVLFKDTKEGMLGIRYNNQLHLPADEPQTFTDALGNKTTVHPGSGATTGNYLSSEGVTGEEVWGTRARWMNLYGSIHGEKVSLVICDHPENFGYPTFWHARGYGLFAANPFGSKDFTSGALNTNYILYSGKSITFRYRFIISSGRHPDKDETDRYAAAFANSYD